MNRSTGTEIQEFIFSRNLQEDESEAAAEARGGGGGGGRGGGGRDIVSRATHYLFLVFQTKDVTFTVLLHLPRRSNK